MRSFLWRIRSNVGWFVAAMALFTALYFVLYASNYRAYDSGVFTYINGLAVNPLGPAGGCTLGFFLLCTKRFTNKESYLYGVSRRAEYLSGLGSAACWSVLSALYALSVSLLTRYCFLSASDMAVPDTVYTLGAGECFAGFALLFVVNMDAYATADILRDFRTRRFWITFLACLAAAVFLLWVFWLSGSIEGYWGPRFASFGTFLPIIFAADFIMSRGRQYR